MKALAIFFAATLVLAETLALAAEPTRYVEYGNGEARRYSEQWDGEFRDLRDSVRAPLLSALGTDAVRFSSQPALGGTGYMIVLSRSGGAEISWFQGHSRSGWRRTHRVRFPIADEGYQSIVSEVDQLLAVGIAEAEARASSREEVIIACGDGPGYLTERIRDGESSWLRPSCSGVNEDIADLLMLWAFVRLGR